MAVFLMIRDHPPVIRQARVLINGAMFHVAVADTEPLRHRGLAGRTEIPNDGGMLFRFPDAAPRTFWMKGMLVPIDIVWVRDGRVLGVVASALPPAAGAPDAEILSFSAPEPVDTVIELRAGRAAELGIRPGHRVSSVLP